MGHSFSYNNYILMVSLLLFILATLGILFLNGRDRTESAWGQQPPTCDSGLYLLLTDGQIERIGNPPLINGGFMFGDDLARDMERAVSNRGSVEKPDLVVLDGSGVTHFVENISDDIPQDFLFPPTPEFPIGRAVDLVMSKSCEGLWVLTDFGGIYRAGDTKQPAEEALVPGTEQIGALGYDVPIGFMRDPRMANPGGASIRAVALIVIDVKEPFNRADGYIVIDSLGAHYSFNPDGTRVMAGIAENAPLNGPLKLLDPDPKRGGYVWPYFAGLDIARDVELYPETLEGVVVFDGWGGIHPVPVDVRSNAVFFTRNEDSNAPPGTLITTVGMPYIVIGFDDPETQQDEGDASTYGADVYSIFNDFEFSAGCPEGGFYTLDKFGAVYVFGSARTISDWLFPPWRLPYIACQNAQDIELFSSDETGPTSTPSLTPSSRSTSTPSLTSTNTPTFAETPTETLIPATSTPSVNPTGTLTPTPSETGTLSPTSTDTCTGTPTVTPTYTETNTFTPTEAGTETPTDTGTVTSTETETENPTSTFTIKETETGTVTETPSQSSTSTWTETPFAPTRTWTETATSTFSSTMTETETSTGTSTETVTITGTGTRPPTEPPPTATRTPVFACVQAAKISLFCAGETSLSAKPFRIKLVPRIDTIVCGVATNTEQPLAIVYVDPSSVADTDPWNETKFTKGFHCEEALGILCEDISAQLNSQGFVAETLMPGIVFFESAVPFSCFLCTDEAGLPCESSNVWPLDGCGLGNLGDGINGNETSFTEGEFSGLTTGLAVICGQEDCRPTPTITATYTPLPTWTPDPNREIITVDIFKMPEDARPMKLVRIPAGSFEMASPVSERDRIPYEGPVHKVTINYDFYMGETEVTQAQWKAVMGSNPVIDHGFPPRGYGNDYPVYYVSWDDCQTFLSVLNSKGQGTFRLPSEAEWEYACRAGTKTRFYFGNSLECDDECTDCAAGIFPGNRSDFMWFCGNNSIDGNKPVYEKSPNLFGLYDMHGSVWEWCQDHWHDNYSGAPTNGSPRLDLVGNDEDIRVMRGGSWADYAMTCRSAYRGFSHPYIYWSATNGLRVVMNTPPTPTPTYNPNEPTWTATPTPTTTNTCTPTLTPYPIREIITVDIPGMPSNARPMRLVRIPAGSFMMGSPDTERGRDPLGREGPVHQVTIGSDFFLGETEVTQAQWKAMMRTILASGEFGVGNDYPVYFVSWNDCQTFLTALNNTGQGTFRLPTEAEWEYACRAGITSRFYFGDSLGCNDWNQDCAAGTLPGNRSDYMWWLGNNTPSGNKPVKSKLPNRFGLYDMHGSVGEWCQDWFQSDFYSQPGATHLNPLCTNPNSGTRVIRSGAWNTEGYNCRSATRNAGYLDDKYSYVGFRVAGTIITTPTPKASPTITRTTTITSTLTVLPTTTITPTPTISATSRPTATPNLNIEKITIPLPNLPELANPLRMVLIPAGSFQMGSSGNEQGRALNESPLHEVTINYNYYIAETEVTQAQWQAVMGNNPSYFKDSNDHPVDSVSWGAIRGAGGFLNKLNALGIGQFRLPSEAEWEYACRASSSTRFNFGDSLDCSDDCSDCAASIPGTMRSDYMWFCGNSAFKSKTVALLEANVFGLYDMHGNVWEWCEDKYHESYNDAPVDGSAWMVDGESHVIRGGAWGDVAKRCRSAARAKSDGQYSYIGFRLACSEINPTPTLEPHSPTPTLQQTNPITPTPFVKGTTTLTPTPNDTPTETPTPT